MYGCFWTIYWQYWADRREDNNKRGFMQNNTK